MGSSSSSIWKIGKINNQTDDLRMMEDVVSEMENVKLVKSITYHIYGR